MAVRGPTVIRVGGGGGGGTRGPGIKCCCCVCCSCLNLQYLTSQHGLVKLAEAVLGGLCQSLLVQYGMSDAPVMGSAFHGFLTTASACLLTTSLLIATYVLSAKSQHLIRQSVFILTTLHFLGLGSYQKGVGNNFLLALSQPKVSQIIHEVVDVLNDPRMYCKYVQFPDNVRDREAIQLGYYQKFGIPGVVGCIDCTHVALVRPTENEERFYCRKRYHSRNVQIESLFNAVACFLYLSASSYMGVAVNLYLYPRYLDIRMYAAYPAMTAVYYIGVVVGILHGVDAYISYKYFKGYR